MVLKIILPSILILLFQDLNSQRLVTFFTDDSVEITADYYFQHVDYPTIVLSHGMSSSRGEYSAIAGKLKNLRYNCLAIDLRFGDNSEFVHNETVRNLPYACTKHLDALKDLDAAINFAYNKNEQQVILFGNNISASLSLLAAKNNRKVAAVVGFTPGEYFTNFKVSEALKPFDKQVFIACSDNEKRYVDELVASIPNNLMFKSIHQAPSGISGIGLLSDENPAHDPFWLDLLFYFKSMSKQH